MDHPALPLQTDADALTTPPSHPALPETPSSSRAGGGGSAKRVPRENETPSQRNKREKAAERQRRKRERDRAAANGAALAHAHALYPPQHGLALPGADDHAHAHEHGTLDDHAFPPPGALDHLGPPPHEFVPDPSPHAHAHAHSSPHGDLDVDVDVDMAGPPEPTSSAPPVSALRGPAGDLHLPPDEAAKRERVRAAARERQRKHRALVKQKKMRELGLDMGTDVLAGVGVTVATLDGGHGQYGLYDAQGYPPPPLSQGPPPPPPPETVPVPPHTHSPASAHTPGPPPPPPAVPIGAGPPPGPPDAMYPQPPPPPQAPPPMQPMMQTQGQQFASMLLLSLSFTPLLKQHLLQSLQMSGEELQQMQPVIAHAYEAWDYQRKMPMPPPPPPPPAAPPAPAPTSVPAASGTPGPAPEVTGASTEYRERFQRSLATPSPFQTAAPPNELALPAAPARAAPPESRDESREDMAAKEEKR